MGRMDGIVAAVTGAGSGIGLATAKLLWAEGARVAALDLQPPGAEEGVLPVTADVTDQSSLDNAAEQVTGAFGGVDVLVCNAGIGSSGTVVDNPDEEWHRVYDVNVVGIVRTVRAFVEPLRASQRAAIVNTASIVSVVGLPQRACYGASKGAVLALTLAMAADFTADGIRVNCVCPGTVDTPWVGRLLNAAPDPEVARRNLIARQPVGRLGTAEEIAEAIVYLASPTSGYVTGTALMIDGGISGFRVPTP
jgi:NAD(P)-dependent dehydrogenase (short-subunit alcohol dehydrogenase family)